MTIRLSLRAVAFVVYTLALLGAAFGISYAVFEWRDGDGARDTSAIEQRIHELEGKVSADSDAQKCAAALAAVNDTPQLLHGPLGVLGEPTPNPVYESITDLIGRYCK